MIKFLTVAFLFFALSPLAHAIDAEDIVVKADEGRIPKGHIKFVATIQDFEQGSEVNKTKYTVKARGNEVSKIETTFPERSKGRNFLMEGDNLWLFTPDVKRAVRVSAQQRLTGEVANGDLARTNYSGDYNAKLIGKEKVDGKDAYHLDLKAKRKDVTYSSIEYWVSVKDFLPIKSVFHAVSGRVLKTGEYLAPKKVLGRIRMTQLRFTDAVDTSKQSLLTYSGHQKMNLPLSEFSKESLGE